MIDLDQGENEPRPKVVVPEAVASGKEERSFAGDGFVGEVILSRTVSLVACFRSRKDSPVVFLVINELLRMRKNSGPVSLQLQTPSRNQA